MAEQKPEYIEYWSQRWEEGRTGWHSKDVNEFLVKFYPQVTGKDLPSTALLDPSSEEFQENSKKTWFVPLCGKTVDIPFLLGLGYRVFGVDGVKKAIETLDAENKLNLKFDEARSVYEGAGGKLKIYCGDLFKCPIEEFGPFDFCWDRGSIIAIEYSQRLLYRNMLQRAFAANKNFSYLLEVLTYDKSKFEGPPRSVDDQDIQTIYGDWTEFQLICTSDKAKVSPAVLEKLGKDGYAVRIFLFKPKN